jgi:GNAT superfamily N-acetyltransferase
MSADEILFRKLKKEELGKVTSIRPDGWPDYTDFIQFYLDNDQFCMPVAGISGEELPAFGNYNLFNKVAWLSHILVRKEYRNKGLGFKVTEYLMKMLKESGCQTIMLLATDMGESVYRKLGFEEVCRYRLYKGEIQTSGMAGNIRKILEGDLEALIELDKEIYGEDRSILISKFYQGGFVSLDNENKINGYYLKNLWEGPVVARNSEDGLNLLRLRTTERDMLFLPETAINGIAALKTLGFVPLDKYVTRMYHGKNPDWKPEMIYGRVAGAFG